MDFTALRIQNHNQRQKGYRKCCRKSPVKTYKWVLSWYTTINDSFVAEFLFFVHNMPWYANIVDFLITDWMLSDWYSQDKKKFLRDVKMFYCDDPYLFKYCSYQIFWKCISDDEVSDAIQLCHSKAYVGHFSSKKTVAKILQCGFYWPTLFKDFHAFCKNV